MNWAVDGWTNTLEKMDYDADIVFLGDSITRGSDFRKSFPNLKIVNLGYSGDTLIGISNRVSQAKCLNPEKIFLLGGINGLTDSNMDMRINQYEDLLIKLKNELPNTEIFVQSVLPISNYKEKSICHNSTINDFNIKVKDLATKNDFCFIDLNSLYIKDGEMNPELTKDGIHLKEEAYDIWAAAISEYIE